MIDSNMQISVEKITPARAQEMLAFNRHNRSLRHRQVKTMAADMAAGNWRMNGETVKFAKDGTLLDGQHRLAAVVESCVTIEMMVVANLELSDQETMDTGRKRTLSDVLSLRGEESTAALASAISIYWQRHKGSVNDGVTPTNQQALAILEDQPELRYSVNAVGKAAKTLRYPRGLAAVLHYEMLLLNADDAVDFWEKLETGLGLQERHPIYILRRRLADNAATIGRKLDGIMIHAYTIKAWNAYRDGREITIIRWTRGGASPETFPELR